MCTTEATMTMMPTWCRGDSLALNRMTTQLVAREEADNPEVQRLCAMTGKTTLSMLAYVTGIVCAFFAPGLSLTIYFLVALVWFMPDKRIESCPAR